MRFYSVANLLLACVLMTSCAPGRSKSLWSGEGSSYSKVAAKKYRTDYDAAYSLPAGGGTCIDDSPGCY